MLPAEVAAIATPGSSNIAILKVLLLEGMDKALVVFMDVSCWLVKK